MYLSPCKSLSDILLCCQLLYDAATESGLFGDRQKLAVGVLVFDSLLPAGVHPLHNNSQLSAARLKFPLCVTTIVVGGQLLQIRVVRRNKRVSNGRRERERDGNGRGQEGEKESKEGREKGFGAVFKSLNFYSCVTISRELVLLTQGWLSAGSSFLARHSADAATSDGRQGSMEQLTKLSSAKNLAIVCCRAFT